jgi:uncharacterized membrane protein YeaQ/YmgE (transglycosylase-associated protein family)
MRQVTNVELTPEAAKWVNDALVWVGFGTIVGLMAKAIMPGRDPGGAVANLAMGVGGTVIGCALMTYFVGGDPVTPISLVGFCVAIGGAFLLLLFYRLLGQRLFIEGEGYVRRPRYARRRARRAVEYVDE